MDVGQLVGQLLQGFQIRYSGSWSDGAGSAFADLLDQFGGQDQAIEKIAEDVAGLLAVVESGVETGGLLLEAPDLDADGAQGGLEFGQGGLDVAERVIRVRYLVWVKGLGVRS